MKIDDIGWMATDGQGQDVVAKKRWDDDKEGGAVYVVSWHRGKMPTHYEEEYESEEATIERMLTIAPLEEWESLEEGEE